MRYVAFLRGINVRGRTIKMDALKKVFEELGYEDIRTVLASGNVVFTITETGIKQLTTTIEEKLQKTFNHTIYVILRSDEQIQQMRDKNPFKNIKITHDVRLYVTFLYRLYSQSTVPHLGIKNDNFHILDVTPTEVYSMLRLSEGNRTVDAMSILDKEYGKRITTRNWNTIEKIAKFLS